MNKYIEKLESENETLRQKYKDRVNENTALTKKYKTALTVISNLDEDIITDPTLPDPKNFADSFTIAKKINNKMKRQVEVYRISTIILASLLVTAIIYIFS